MAQFYRRARENRTLSIFLIIILSWFIGSNLAPSYVSRFIPGFYQAQNCAWVRTSEERANHQSLLGRNVANPISLQVTTTAINPTDAAGSLFVQIMVINNTLGTVPFVYDPATVLVGDNGTSGLGLIFNPQNSLSAGLGRFDPGVFPDAQIKLLGPRQRCIHTVEFPNGNVLIDPGISSGNAQVRAYYRNNTRGAVNPPQISIYGNGIVSTPIFNDAGLWVGYVESPAVLVPLASAATQ